MRKTWCQSVGNEVSRTRAKIKDGYSCDRGENKTPSKDETIVDTSKRREK